jgi:uncharacterized protein (TIGR02444 family)
VSGFWEWSQAAYSRPKASAILLRLQDEFALNVNILLWCCWCAVTYGAPSELALRKAADLTEGWSREVTAPLRAARRALKAAPKEALGAEALRASVQSAELDAERIEQAMLERLALDALAPARETLNPPDEARRALARYADIADAVRRKGFSVSALDELARALFADAAIEAP